MDWFNPCFKLHKSALKIAHFTDCHLFANKNGEYFKVNTYDGLKKTLQNIKEQQVDLAIFGGDLTQDHTLGSYQNFAQLIADSGLTCPVFWLPGNHDELALFEAAFKNSQINTEKCIDTHKVQILLLNTKSNTPSGEITQTELSEIALQLTKTNKPTIVFCHHHPIKVNGYIDKHILTNGEQLLAVLTQNNKVPLLVHGHVHNDYSYQYSENNGQLAIKATPATSIQFTKNSTSWQQQDLGPGYRIIEVSQQGEISTQVIWINPQ